MALAPKRRKIRHLQLCGCWLRLAAVDSDETFAFQVQNNLLSCLLWRQLTRVYSDFGVGRFFVRIRYSCKFLQDTGAGFGVQTFSVALLADFHWCRKVHQNKAAKWVNQRPHVLASGIVGRDRRADGDTAVLSNFRGDIANTANVDVAVFLRETEL